MRKFIALIIISAIAYFGYTFYRESRQSDPLVTLNPIRLGEVTFQNSVGSLDNLQHVLGDSVENVIDNGRNWLNDATSGASEPIVNRAINNFQTELKQLPAEQVEKIKYDFCKPIVTEYEKR